MFYGEYIKHLTERSENGEIKCKKLIGALNDAAGFTMRKLTIEAVSYTHLGRAERIQIFFRPIRILILS